MTYNSLYDSIKERGVEESGCPRLAHNQEIVGSNPTTATMSNQFISGHTDTGNDHNPTSQIASAMPIGDYHPPTDAKTPYYPPAQLTPTYWFNEPTRDEQIRIAAIKAAAQVESGSQYPSPHDAIEAARKIEKYIREG